MYTVFFFQIMLVNTISQMPLDTLTHPWWRHPMEAFFALLAFCAGISPVTGEFPTQWPVPRSFDIFLALRLSKRLNKQSKRRWFKTPSRSLWRHSNDYDNSISIKNTIHAPYYTACWVLLTHVCVSGLGHHWLTNGLAPVTQQPITWTNDGLLSVRWTIRKGDTSEKYGNINQHCFRKWLVACPGSSSYLNQCPWNLK